MTPVSGFLNLFLQASATPTSGLVNLYTQGATSGYTYEFNSVPMYIKGEPIVSYMNLYTTGRNLPATKNTYINMFLAGKGEPANNSLDLVVWGSSASMGGLGLNSLTLEELEALTLDQLYTLSLEGEGGPGIGGYHFDNNISLYISGEGQLESSVPASGYMNLYLHATPGVERGLALFLKGPEGTDNSINLFTNGITGFAASGLNLYMDSIGLIDESVDLFTRGYTTYE
jgi:hypothetical protein